MSKIHIGYVNRPFRGHIVGAYINSSKYSLWHARIPYQEIEQYILIKDNKVQVIRCGDGTRENPEDNVEILQDILSTEEVKISHEEEEYLFKLLKKLCSKGNPFKGIYADAPIQTLILRNKNGTEYKYWGSSIPRNDLGFSEALRNITGIHDLNGLDHDTYFEDPADLNPVEADFEILP